MSSFYNTPESTTGSGTTAPQIQGSTASGSTNSGNPVKIAAVFNTTRPTFTDGQLGDLQMDNRGNLGVGIFNGTQAAAFGANNADGVAASSVTSRIQVIGYNYQWNSGASTWDRQLTFPTNGAATHATGGVTTSSATVLASNTSRKYLIIQNVSDTDVWINIAGGTATAAAPSLKLIASTGVLIFETGYVPTAAITAIHGGTGTKNISIVSA